ncbi:ADP-ribosylglycohydrolase family protein [Rathayibacter soli]|uniref:ADP-ribosylglycohydrolase family protein n=1 Tax=Rathayibacter soli TaxID=3144168 RepID=UPI0027E4E85C|nr:ADP-ribosylglycohydrolase family protein [Glaciibacter superstes]
MTTSRSHLQDRAVGAVLGSAAGDALGAPYEFKPSLPDHVPVVLKAGGPWQAGEWTDDTSMAIPLLQMLADGESLDDAAVLGRVVADWQGWARTAKDVGIQTRQVLARAAKLDHDAPVSTEVSARAAAKAVHQATGRSAGNGSLMRTGPVALGYLGDPAGLAVAARRISDLTHFETDAGDACVIWSLAIRHAILTGEYDIRTQIDALPADRQARWHGLIDTAEAVQPRDVPGSNGWVVAALQAAWSAIHRGDGLLDTLERVVRCGNDTDTVAAIAGALAGAKWGGSAVPAHLRRVLHGWPGLRTRDLVGLAVLAVDAGKPNKSGWPLVDRMPLGGTDTLVQHPHDSGVWLGDIAALDRLPANVDAVVSLCRVGRMQVPARVAPEDHIEVWLIDEDGANLNVDLVLADTADAIASLRAEGHTVLVHCFEARSRTPSVAAAYAVRQRGVPAAQVLAEVRVALSDADPKPFLQEAVQRVVPVVERDKRQQGTA